MPSRRSVLALGGLLATAACGRAAANHTASHPASHETSPAPAGTLHATAQPPAVVHHAPAQAASAVEVTHGPRTTPAVALTFHGGGDPALAVRILAAAEQRRTTLTIFAVGDWLAAYPTMAARIVGGGHELGNHTYTHPDDFPTLSPAAQESELLRCRQLIQRQTTAPARYARPAATTRASAATLAALGAVGYPVSVSYDVDALDYDETDPAVVAATVARLARPGSIVSLHCGYASTVAAMPAILDVLAAKGLAPVTVSELLA